MRRRWITGATVGLLVLAACSGGDDGDDGGDASPATTQGGTVGSTAARQITGGPFCEFAFTFSDRYARVNPAAGTQALRTSFEEASAAISEAEKTAPPEIKTDVALMATTFRELVTALRDANFDFTKVPPATLQRIQNPDFVAAGQRLENYTRDNCRVVR